MHGGLREEVEKEEEVMEEVKEAVACGDGRSAGEGVVELQNNRRI